VLGALLTLVLPEPAGRGKDEISGADDVGPQPSLLAETDRRTATPEADAPEPARRVRPLSAVVSRN
jgi:hypothetical protein